MSARECVCALFFSCEALINVQLQNDSVSCRFASLFQFGRVCSLRLQMCGGSIVVIHTILLCRR